MALEEKVDAELATDASSSATDGMEEVLSDNEDCSGFVELRPSSPVVAPALSASKTASVGEVELPRELVCPNRSFSTSSANVLRHHHASASSRSEMAPMIVVKACSSWSAFKSVGKHCTSGKET